MNGIAKIIYDTYKGNIPTKYASVSKSERDEAIRKELLNALGIEKFERKAFRRAWAKNKHEVYAVIEEVVNQVMVDGEYQKSAFFNQFVEVKNLALGDTNEFYVEGKNELIVSEFSGSHFDLRRQRIDAGQTFPVAVRDYGIKVYEYFERILSGRASIENLVTLLYEAIDKKLSEIAESTFMVAMEKLPTPFKVGGNYDEDAILEMLAHLEATNGEKPILVGTKMALRKLQGIVGGEWSDGMKETRNNALVLPVWNSYTCMEIAQGHKIGSFEFTMPNNKVYAISGSNTKLVKMVLEGDTLVKEISDGTDNADMSLETAVIFKAGVAVAYNKMIGEISLA